MSVNTTRNPEMVEALSPDFRRLYSPTHALGDAIDMMQSLPVCRAIYPGSVNGGRVASPGGGISDAPSDNWMYARRNAAWVSGGFGFQNDVGIKQTSPATDLHIGSGTESSDITLQSNGRSSVILDNGSQSFSVRLRGDDLFTIEDETFGGGGFSGNILRVIPGWTITAPLLCLDASIANGAIGINEIAPAASLHITHSSQPVIILEDSGATTQWELKSNASTFEINEVGTGGAEYVVSGGSHTWRNGSTQLANLSTSGNLLVGQISASSTIIRAIYDSGSYMQMTSATAVQSILSSVNNSGDALMDIYPIPQDGTSLAYVRMFRSTNTTGSVFFQVLFGNNTTTTNCQLGGNTNSYLNSTTGNVGIGHSAVPAGKLDIRTSSGFSAPVLYLNQSDLSEEFINFVSTIGASNPIQTSALGSYYGKARVAVNGTFKYMALYNS